MYKGKGCFNKGTGCEDMYKGKGCFNKGRHRV